MNKIAWLITHDNYIDRRIFFFADVLEKNEYQVTLFPSYYFDLLSDRDPVYVSRPTDHILVKEYEFSEESLPGKCREYMEIIQEKQKEFFEDKKQYAKSLRDLNLPLHVKSGQIRTESYGSFYSIIYMDETDKYVYNSLTDSYRRILRKHIYQEASLYEQAIMEYITKYSEFDEQAYSVGNINVRSQWNEYGEKVYFAQNPACNFMFSYNRDTKELSKITAIPVGDYGMDDLLGKQFDYREYKEIIYEYSPILKNIKRHLEKEKPDVVYVADLPTLPIGIMLKETTGCKLMIDCHEWWYKQAALWEADFERKIYLSEKFEKLLYPQCDLCITVGEYLASDMSKCYGKPFVTIYSCMSQELCVKEGDYDPEIWNRLFGIPLDAKIAVFQGSMTTLRNLDNLARATRYMDDDQYLIMVGGGPYEPEFRRILNSEGNPDRVKFVGWVNQKDLMKYTVNADLGILPYSAMNEYFSYSVPNKLMEYFEATMPMLYDISMKEISMVAGNHHVGIGADLSDPKIFGETIRELLNSPEELKRMKENYTACKDKFQYINQEKEFEKLLKAL